jgi:hypothetical protein
LVSVRARADLSLLDHVISNHECAIPIAGIPGATRRWNRASRPTRSCMPLKKTRSGLARLSALL